MRDAFGQFPGEFFLEFGVDDVTFGDGKHPLFREKLGVVELEFGEQRLVTCRDVVFFAAYHEEQHRVALDMPEEPRAYALAFVRSFDDAWDVGHHERAVVAVADDAEVGLKGGECVGCDLWLGGGD